MLQHHSATHGRHNLLLSWPQGGEKEEGQAAETKGRAGKSVENGLQLQTAVVEGSDFPSEVFGRGGKI